MRWLFLLFIGMPILEMWVLIEVGSMIGAWPTIGLVLLTAMIGLALLRQQGFNTLLRAQQRMNSGQLPAVEILEGMFLAVGGALLLTPGFITDAIGFVCLLRPLRRGLIQHLLRRGIIRMQTPPGGPGPGPGGPGGGGASPGPRNPKDSGRVIEGDFRRED